MRNDSDAGFAAEILDFVLLQGPNKQHVLALRGGTWWDIELLLFTVVLAGWVLKTFFTGFTQFRKFDAVGALNE